MAYTTVKTDKAEFRIILEFHDVPPFKKDLEGKWDGVLHEIVFKPEMVEPWRWEDVRSEALIEASQEVLNGDLAPVKPRLEKENASLWFGDLLSSPRLRSLQRVQKMKAGVGSAISLGATVWLREVLHSVRDEREITRRDFLKAGLGVGAVGLGAWLASSLEKSWLAVLIPQREGDVNEKITTSVIKEAVAKSSHLHPDETTIFLRNLVWAEKLEYLAETLSVEKRKEAKILVVAGAEHAGAGDMIKWGRNVRHFVFSFYQPFLPDIFKDPEQLRELRVKRDFLVPQLVSWLDPEGKILGKEGHRVIGVSGEAKG